MAPLENSTSQQAAALLDSMERLEAELHDHRPIVEEANRRSRIARTVGIIGLVVGVIGLAAGGTGLWAARKADQSIDTNRDAIAAVEALVAQIEQDRADARRAGCIGDNGSILGQRASLVSTTTASLRVLAEDPENLTAEETALLNAYRKQAAAEAERSLPFRDCSPPGIERYIEHPPIDPATLPPPTLPPL